MAFHLATSTQQAELIAQVTAIKDLANKRVGQFKNESISAARLLSDVNTQLTKLRSLASALGEEAVEALLTELQQLEFITVEQKRDFFESVLDLFDGPVGAQPACQHPAAAAPRRRESDGHASASGPGQVASSSNLQLTPGAAVSSSFTPLAIRLRGDSNAPLASTSMPALQAKLDKSVILRDLKARIGVHFKVYGSSPISQLLLVVPTNRVVRLLSGSDPFAALMAYLAAPETKGAFVVFNKQLSILKQWCDQQRLNGDSYDYWKLSFKSGESLPFQVIDTKDILGRNSSCGHFMLHWTGLLPPGRGQRSYSYGRMHSADNGFSAQFMGGGNTKDNMATANIRVPDPQDNSKKKAALSVFCRTMGMQMCVRVPHPSEEEGIWPPTDGDQHDVAANVPTNEQPAGFDAYSGADALHSGADAPHSGHAAGSVDFRPLKRPKQSSMMAFAVAAADSSRGAAGAGSNGGAAAAGSSRGAAAAGCNRGAAAANAAAGTNSPPVGAYGSKANASLPHAGSGNHQRGAPSARAAPGSGDGERSGAEYRSAGESARAEAAAAHALLYADEAAAATASDGGWPAPDDGFEAEPWEQEDGRSTGWQHDESADDEGAAEPGDAPSGDEEEEADQAAAYEWLRRCVDDATAYNAVYKHGACLAAEDIDSGRLAASTTEEDLPVLYALCRGRMCPWLLGQAAEDILEARLQYLDPGDSADEDRES